MLSVTRHVQVTERIGRPSHYKLTTTVMTWLVQKNEEEGFAMNLGGSIMRQKEDDIASDNGIVSFAELTTCLVPLSMAEFMVEGDRILNISLQDT